MEQEERRLKRKLKEEQLITEMRSELKKLHERKGELGKHQQRTRK